MPTQIEPAKFTSIHSLDASMAGQKLRIAGRLLGYDAVHGMIGLLDADGKHTVTINVEEVLDDASSRWVKERLGTLIVMGYLEESPEELPVLDTITFARGMLRPPTTLFIRAILVLPAEDLDMNLWGAVVDAEKATT